MDTIQINDIRVYGYIGALPEENILGQWFTVNLTLWLDLNPAGKTDQLTDTLDYQDAIAIVKKHISTAKYALIERLCAVIADDLFTLPLVQQVRVQLIKERPPIPDFSGTVAIEMTRSRPQ